MTLTSGKPVNHRWVAIRGLLQISPTRGPENARIAAGGGLGTGRRGTRWWPPPGPSPPSPVSSRPPCRWPSSSPPSYFPPLLPKPCPSAPFLLPPPPRRGAHAMSPPLVRRCPSWCWASPPSSSSTSAGSDACTRKSLQPSRLSPTSFLARSARRVDWFDVLDLGRRLERSAVSDAFFEDPNSLNKVLPDSSCRGRLGLCHVVHDRCLLISLCELL